MLRSGIWEESKKPKSCLRAKRRAGQLADAQTIPARRLTTPLRLLRSSDRFLQSHISRLSPSPESVLQPSAPLPAHFQTEVLLTKQTENAEVARLRAFRLQKPSVRALLLEAIYSLASCPKLLENSSYFESLSAGVEDVDR